MPKLRYGVQLYGKFRHSTEVPLSSDIQKLQLNQNIMLRSITNSKLADQTSIKSLLEKTGFSSVNQLNVEIKLNEGWTSLNLENYSYTL